MNVEFESDEDLISVINYLSAMEEQLVHYRERVVAMRRLAIKCENELHRRSKHDAAK